MDWIAQILALILSQATPEVRKLACEAISSLEEKAHATPNPWDDLLALFLKGIMSCDK